MNKSIKLVLITTIVNLAIFSIFYANQLGQLTGANELNDLLFSISCENEQQFEERIENRGFEILPAEVPKEEQYRQKLIEFMLSRCGNRV